MNSQHMCCRQFFIQNQCLQDAQSKILQYKNYEFPYDYERQHQLKKAICGMLNTQGGYIFVGIKQTKERRRIVTAQIYNEDLKENILKYYRLLGNLIKPSHIIIKELIEFEFIPIKSQTTEKYIKGGYVFRIRVKKGDPKSFYYFTQRNEDFYFKRTKNETIRLKTQDAFEDFKSKIESTQVRQQSQSQFHPGKCKIPQKGQQDFSKAKLDQAFPIVLERNEHQRPKSKNVTHQHGQRKTSPKTKDQFAYERDNKNSFKPKTDHKHLHQHQQTLGSGFKNSFNNKPQTVQYRPASLKQSQISYNQVCVLINISENDYQQFFKKSHWAIEVTRSQITDVVIVLIDMKDLIDFKSKFESFTNMNKSTGVFLSPTQKLGFQKLNIDIQTLLQIVNGYCRENRYKMPHYDPRDKVFEFQNSYQCAKIYLELRQKGIKSRFKN